MPSKLKPWELPPPTPEEIKRNGERALEAMEEIRIWKGRKLAEEATRKAQEEAAKHP